MSAIILRARATADDIWPEPVAGEATTESVAPAVEQRPTEMIDEGSGQGCTLQRRGRMGASDALQTVLAWQSRHAQNGN